MAKHQALTDAQKADQEAEALRCAREIEAAGQRPTLRAIGLRMRRSLGGVGVIVARARDKGAWPWPAVQRRRRPGLAIRVNPYRTDAGPRAPRRVRRTDWAAWEASMEEWRKAGGYLASP